MATVEKDNQRKTIAYLKAYFPPTVMTWLESLNIDDQEPLEWTFIAGKVRDPDKEKVSGGWMCWKLTNDLTIQISHNNQEYTQTFMIINSEWQIEE